MTRAAHPLLPRAAGARFVRGALLTGLLLAGCADARPNVIDHDTFVGTWVDLRLAVGDTVEGELGEAERARILGKHGVSEKALLRFVDAHGDDPSFMTAVWADIESRLAPPEDSLSGGPAPSARPSPSGPPPPSAGIPFP